MDYLTVNKTSWDKRTDIHIESDFYDVSGFLAGKSSLNDIELTELGSVANKRLLHLQCHFGLDTLSWARLGAEVTGVDLSPNAIEQARAIADKANLEAEFICSDVYGFADHPAADFDLVFTSYGAICWLPDLTQWAQLIAAKLKPGGCFYMAETHPFHDILSGYSYFHRDEPDVEEETTYTENAADELTTVVTWAHPISEVVNALINAGLNIKQLNEYPYHPYSCFSGMEEKQPGQFYYSHNGQDAPMIYTIRAEKP